MFFLQNCKSPVATGRLKHRDRLLSAPREQIPRDAMIQEPMTYAKRKEISEPVFGQI